MLPYRHIWGPRIPKYILTHSLGSIAEWFHDR